MKLMVTRLDKALGFQPVLSAGLEAWLYGRQGYPPLRDCMGRPGTCSEENGFVYSVYFAVDTGLGFATYVLFCG